MVVGRSGEEERLRDIAHIRETSLLFFFFFQAEDGIRDTSVTGVQTCALPICRYAGGRHAADVREDVREPSVLHRQAGEHGGAHHPLRPPPRRRDGPVEARSEERRVGKECGAWWSVDREKRKD